MSGCPCDSCVHQKENYTSRRCCPNFNYFFDAVLQSYVGILKTDPCDSYEPEEVKE